MRNRDVIDNTINWLVKEMDEMQYGDVGIVFSISKGEVTKIKRVNEVSVTPAVKTDSKVKK